MMEKIIFDYGGVFTHGSRAEFVARTLGSSEEQQAQVLAFFGSGFIKEAARGKWTTTHIVQRLQGLLEGRNAEQISATLEECCRPDISMMQLLERLKTRYQVFLISDSLPPYSEYIRRNFANAFTGIFLSDELGKRKHEGLYHLAEALQPGLFRHAIYIDDRAANLPPAISRGAQGLLFTSTQALVEELEVLSI